MKQAIDIKSGDKFHSFYGDGTYIGIIEISDVTKSSIFVKNDRYPGKGRREGINTVKKYLNKGMWKPA